MSASEKHVQFAQHMKPGLSFICINTIFIYIVLHYEMHYLHAENGLLENLQGLFLAGGTLAFLLLRTASQPERVLNLSIALLCFSFLLREIDIEYLNIPALLQELGSGTDKKVLLLLLWAFVAYRFFRQVPEKGRFIRDFIQSGQFQLFVAALFLLLVSLVLDKKLLVPEFPRLYEELVETNAYLLMVAGGFVRIAHQALMPLKRAF